MSIVGLESRWESSIAQTGHQLGMTHGVERFASTRTIQSSLYSGGAQLERLTLEGVEAADWSTFRDGRTYQPAHSWIGL